MREVSMKVAMDITTSYLGMKLAHPFIAGASPFGYRLDTIKRLEDAGCAALVLHSLFEEQISYAHTKTIAHINVFEPDFADILSAFPESGDYSFGPDEYAEHVRRAKQAVSIPVIASLNGRTAETWLKFARVIEQAGADALELNMYQISADLSASGNAVEDELTGVVRNLKHLIKIPVAVKLSPFFTALANIANQLDRAGADGLVLFNRFYQPDIDIRTMSVSPRLELSTSAELLLRLRWIAILHGRIRPSLALSGGAATPMDGIKAILAGADVVQMVSALLLHGPAYVALMRRGLEDWLDWHAMERLGDARGLLSLKTTRDPASFERAHYIRTLHSWQSPRPSP
jgi:dihydroorotate dehydrogenase (fumarate)